MPRLDGQVVLITGCSSGIGLALARAFDAQGHRTFATARRLEALVDLPDSITPLKLDVTNPEQVSEAVSEVVKQAGRIDMVINNAGFILVGPLAEVPLSDFRAQLETNVLGALAVAQAAFPYMADRRYGRIVNVGSIVGVLPTPFAGAYCASKSALHMVSEVLRMELSPFGIKVVLVEPGRVRSRIAVAASRGLERYASQASRYQSVHERIRARASASQDCPMDTDSFAARLVAEVTRSRPPRVLRLGRGARFLPLLTALPRAVLDRLLMRRFGVDALEPIT